MLKCYKLLECKQITLKSESKLFIAKIPDQTYGKVASMKGLKVPGILFIGYQGYLN